MKIALPETTEVQKSAEFIVSQSSQSSPLKEDQKLSSASTKQSHIENNQESVEEEEEFSIEDALTRLKEANGELAEGDDSVEARGRSHARTPGSRSSSESFSPSRALERLEEYKLTLKNLDTNLALTVLETYTKELGLLKKENKEPQEIEERGRSHTKTPGSRSSSESFSPGDALARLEEYNKQLKKNKKAETVDNNEKNMDFERAVARKAVLATPSAPKVVAPQIPSREALFDEMKNVQLKPVAQTPKPAYKHDAASVAERLLQTMDENPAVKQAYFLAIQLANRRKVIEDDQDQMDWAN